MQVDHYATLGIARFSSDSEIKKAWRKLARELHPDLNSSEEASQQFLKVKEAYEVLSEPSRKSAHDMALRFQEESAKKIAESDRPASTREQTEKERYFASQSKLNEARTAMQKGDYLTAKARAEELLQIQPRNAEAHAMLGDIHLLTGSYKEAEKAYAYATQFDPGNEAYFAMHAKMHQAISSGERSAKQESNAGPFFLWLFVIGMAGAYSAFADMEPLRPDIPWLDTLTLGQIVMFLIVGLATGGCCAAAGVLERWTFQTATLSVQRVSVWVYGLVSLLSFWLSAIGYLVIGAIRGRNRSLNWLFGMVIFCLILLGAILFVSGLRVSIQVVMWGGNIAFPASVLGWFLIDRIRSRA